MHGIAIPISAVFTALLALMLVAISIRITVLRAGKKINLLDGGDEQLRRAIRVQGNFIEYVPIALILLALTEWSGAQAWLVYCFGAALLPFRMLIQLNR